MDNPYAPPTPPDTSDPLPRRRSTPLWIAIALGIAIAIHYVTGAPIFWESKPLMNWVLLTCPIAISCQYWIWHTRPSKIWVLLSLAVSIRILTAMGSEWIWWFSTDPYQSFILMNNYFGPYGWHHWLWVITTGLLPLFFLFRYVRETLVCRRWLAAMILIGYFDNILLVLRACHT